MQNPNLSRRAIVAGAASVPALALPAVALADAGADTELLQLGVELDRYGKDWLAQSILELRSGVAWEADCLRAGLPRVEFGDEDWDKRQRERDLVPHSIDDGDTYDEHGCSIIWSTMGDRESALIEKIFEHKARTLAGLAVQTHAMVLYNHTWWTCSYEESHEQERLFLEHLCSFFGITPAPFVYAQSPEYRAYYGGEEEDEAVQS